MGIKSIQIAKYIIFINDLLLSVNLTINHIIYFTQKGIAVNNLNFLNITFGILYFIRLICIIAVVKNRKKMQKNVRVKYFYIFYIINILLKNILKQLHMFNKLSLFIFSKILKKLLISAKFLMILTKK